MYNSLLVLAYVENPADCPLVRFIFTNLVARHATKSYTTRCEAIADLNRTFLLQAVWKKYKDVYFWFSVNTDFLRGISTQVF